MIEALLLVAALKTVDPPNPPPTIHASDRTIGQRRPIPTFTEGQCLHANRAAKNTAAFAWAPHGWTLTCKQGLAGYGGWTIWPTKEIVLNADKPINEQRSWYAHELGHAEMFEWPQWKRDALEQTTGRVLGDYWSPDGQLIWGRYESDPGELWAQGRMYYTTGQSLGGRPFYTDTTLREWSQWTR